MSSVPSESSDEVYKAKRRRREAVYSAGLESIQDLREQSHPFEANLQTRRVPSSTPTIVPAGEEAIAPVVPIMGVVKGSGKRQRSMAAAAGLESATVGVKYSATPKSETVNRDNSDVFKEGETFTAFRAKMTRAVLTEAPRPVVEPPLESESESESESEALRPNRRGGILLAGDSEATMRNELANIGNHEGGTTPSQALEKWARLPETLTDGGRGEAQEPAETRAEETALTAPAPQPAVRSRRATPQWLTRGGLFQEHMRRHREATAAQVTSVAGQSMEAPAGGSRVAPAAPAAVAPRPESSRRR